MTCRHSPGDPDCSSSTEGRARIARENEEHARQASARRQKELDDRTPDPDKYEILDLVEVGPHLVVKAKYISCVKCSFEGVKVMVFLDCETKDVVFWRRIDPHFREPAPTRALADKLTSPAKEAPPPRARFPGDAEGWHDALAFARAKAPRP